MKLDRTAQGAAAFVAALDPRRLYRVQYPGVVVAQGGPDSFDFQPDDPRVPGVSGIPMRLPTPGVTVTVDPAQRPRALLAFAGGDPSRPELHLWERSGLFELVVQAAAKISLVASSVNIGGDPATDALVKGTTYRAAEDALLTAIGAFATATGVATNPAVATAASTLVAAIGAFQGAGASYLSTIGRTS